MLKKKVVSRSTSTTSHKLIALKLDEVKELVIKNSKDIEDLKAEVNMGKGGIRAIFAIASMLAIILGLFKFFKLYSKKVLSKRKSNDFIDLLLSFSFLI